MKQKLRSKRAVTILAAVSMFALSLTVLALVSDTVLEIDNTGDFGASTFTGSPVGSIAVGASNEVKDDNSAAIGESLVCYDENCLVVGKWNLDTGGEEIFVIGIGSSSERKNALEVFTDGEVRVPQVQGDISMDDFGN